MRQSSRHWLAGSALSLVVLGAALTGWSLQAQPPGAPSPRAFPPSEVGSAPPAAPRLEENPASGSAIPSAVQTGVQKQGDLLRVVRNVPGDAKPIVLEADQISTWHEGGHIVFLLTGRVLVQQSVVQGRCQQAVARVDLPRYRQTGILHMDLYAEGQVRIDTSIEIQDGARGCLDLNTRGEFRVRASRGKVQRQDQSQQPIVGRARVHAPGLDVTNPIKTVAAPATALPPVPGVTPAPVQPASLPPASRTTIPPVQPAVLPPAVPLPPVGSGSFRQMSHKEDSSDVERLTASGLVQVQAVEPAPGGSPAPSAPAVPPAADAPPPGSLFPGPGPGPAPLPVPPPPVRPDPDGPPAEPSPDPTLPDVLPPPIPAPHQARQPGTLPPPTPLPPPSQPAVPPRPGQLPPRSTPGQPLEHRLLPRSGEAPNLKIEDQPGGTRVITVTGGLILNVRNVPRIGVIDVEADRAVVWVKNRDANRVADNLRSDQGETSTELEFYLAGHVVFRANQPSGKERAVIEAEEMYYDARRNVAVALNSRLELRSDRANSRSLALTEPVILQAPALFRTGPNTFEVREAEIFSSKLPSDPGLKLLVAEATVTNSSRPRTDWFGRPVLDKKGNPVQIEESIVEARNVVATVEDVPFFYTPFLVTDARDPLGPLETINFGANRIYGFQTGVGLNVYKLLGLLPVEGTRWRLLADYLSRRGPALGSNFDYFGKLDDLADPADPDGVVPTYDGMVRLYGLYDEGTDILGGNRPYLPFQPSGWRGRALWRQGIYDLPYGFTVQSQVSLLSDRNFLEQYFKPEFDTDPNQANFVYVKQQQDNWAWSALGQARQANWITTTEWLPRLDGYLIGQDLFDRLTSNTRVSLAFARLKPSSDPAQPLAGVAVQPPDWPMLADPTTARIDTGRAALMEELSLPLQLGAFRVVPYAKGAVVGYTEDLQGESSGRGWGGGGVRASLPLTRLFADAESELFNVKGLNHKMVLSGNYFIAGSTDSYSRYPQLDRLHDDATASMLREFKPNEPIYNVSDGVALATSPLFDPQRYAIRRLIDNRLDTLDRIQVFQLDLRQRLQTKRGYPGFEHIIDWMVLDTSVSYFPDADRDNFGKPFSFLEYNYLWNIGDRTSIDSYGWYDPQDNGARVYTFGMHFTRPDRTTFHLGYRHMDPLHSRIVIASMSYVFSPKYAATLGMAYDFGTTEAVTNTLVFTRTGTDLQVSMGFMYNSLQNNFGAIVEIVPNLMPNNRRMNMGTLASANSMFTTPR